MKRKIKINVEIKIKNKKIETIQRQFKKKVD